MKRDHTHEPFLCLCPLQHRVASPFLSQFSGFGFSPYPEQRGLTDSHELPSPHFLSSVFISLGSLFSNFPGLLTIPQSLQFLFLGLCSSHLVSRVQIKCIQLPHPAAPMRLSSHASSFISLLIRTSHFIFSVPHCWPSVCTTITQLGVFIPNCIWLIHSFIHTLQQLFPGSFAPGTLLEDGSVMRGTKQRWYLFPDTIFRQRQTWRTQLNSQR